MPQSKEAPREDQEPPYAVKEIYMPPKPAVSLAAVAGRRKATLELAQRVEQEGFSGIYCPSFGDGMGLCEALALTTHEIPFGTSTAFRKSMTSQAAACRW